MDESTPLHVIGIVLARLVGYGVAVWLVFEAGAGVHSDGSAGRRLWATVVVVAGLAIVLAVCTGALILTGEWDTARLLGRLGVRDVAAVILALLLAVPVCAALGLPYHLSGVVGLALSTASVTLVAFQASRLPRDLIRPDYETWNVVLFGGYLLTFGALWLADVILPGIRLSGGLGERLATLAVLAAFFRIAGGNVFYFIRNYGLARLVPSVLAPLAVTGLKLWLLCRLSRSMAATLLIDDFRALALAAVLVTALTAPVWLFEQWARGERMAEDYRLQWEAEQRERTFQTMTTLSAISTARYVSERARQIRRDR